MQLTYRELTTIHAALGAWEDELSEGERWIRAVWGFRDCRPLSLFELRELRERLRESKRAVAPDHLPVGWPVMVPTYLGAQARGNPLSPEFGRPDVPILIQEVAGVRLLLGTHDPEDRSKPDIMIERRPRGWAIFLHTDAGDPVGHVYILDSGSTYLMREACYEPPIEIVDDIPRQLDVL